MLDDSVATTEETSEPQAPRLTRSSTDKVVAGVCGGLGRYFSIDPIVFRITFVVLALAGWGGGVVLYLVGWLVMPEDDGSQPAYQTRPGAGARIVGGALIAVGAVALLDRFVPWLDKLILPLAVIAAGALIIWGGVRRDSPS